MAETNTSNIGFEKQIWDAACVPVSYTHLYNLVPIC